MPSGKTHDAITIFLTVPAFAGAWYFLREAGPSLVITAGMLFGGLMFGPDLDTNSKQYARWGFFRHFWYPYQAFFSHRSRWSHGLLLGTLLRVVYFMGTATLAIFLALYAFASYMGGDLPNLLQLAKAWQPIGETAREYFGGNAFYFLFFGLWAGAASHTFTDMAVSYVKTGRVTEFL